MNDLTFAWRSLLKSPGFTLVSVLTLALGIGVNTSMFSVTNAVLLQPLPFARPAELMQVFRTSPQSQQWPHAAANYLEIKAEAHSFSALAGFAWSSCNYAAPGEPAERWRGMDVTEEFFPALGVPAHLGRTFSAEDVRVGAPPVVVLDYELWTGRFASDPGIVGRQVRIDGELATVRGVMPAGFVPRLAWGPIDLWRPLAFTAQQQQNRENNFLSILGRLAPGVNRDQARTELDGISLRLERAYPATNAGNGLHLLALGVPPKAVARQMPWLLLGLAGFVLLIACVNLANLQFARTAGRAREHAVRLALGATRWRIIRELLVESLLLALLGGLGGLVLSLWGNDFVGRQLVDGTDHGMNLPLDLRVFGFALGISTLAGLAFGLAPAWLSARADVNEALKQQTRAATGGRAQQRLRQGLIVIEVALALVLLAGAGVFLRGLRQFTARDPGWKANELLVGSINLPANKYPNAASRRAFFEKLDRGLASNPRIEHAAIASSLPFREYSSSMSFGVEGRPGPKPGTEPVAKLVFVNPAFFETLGLPLQRGRLFTMDDRAERPAVVVINETMARALWPGENPVGRRIGDPDNAAWIEIVGVVGEVHAVADLNPPDTAFQMYRPLAQEFPGYASLAVRGSVAPGALADALRRAVAEIDPDQPVSRIQTGRGQIERELSTITTVGTLLGGFAVLGLALAALGIYGVQAGFVATRTREMGVRMALGAQPRDVLRVVLGQGLRLAGLGTLLGLLLTFGLVRVLTHLVPGLGSPEVLTLGGVIGLLLAVMLLACWLPARRAVRIDPMVALRAE